MQSHILPISNRSLTPSPSSVTMGTMLLRSEDDLSATRILISPQFDEEKAIEVEPFLPRAPKYVAVAAAAGSTNFYQKRRRRTAGETSDSDGGGDSGLSFCEGVDHAASDASLMTRFRFNFLRYLG